MDPSGQHVLRSPDQLPDENYIERLFPKCPPKQHQRTSGHRRLQVTQSKLNAPLVQQNQQPTRRRNKSKSHQYSRRELEALRNNRSMNINDKNTIKVQNQQSTDSSDNENIGGKKDGLKRCISANDYQSTIAYQRSLGSESMHTNESVNSAKGTTNLPSVTKTNRKKTSKYTASQNLQQLLQRSHSSQSQNYINPSSTKFFNDDAASIHETSNYNVGRTNLTDNESSRANSEIATKCNNASSMTKHRSSDGMITAPMRDSENVTCRTSRGVVFGNLIDKIDSIPTSISATSLAKEFSEMSEGVGATPTTTATDAIAENSNAPSRDDQQTADTTLDKTAVIKADESNYIGAILDKPPIDTINEPTTGLDSSITKLDETIQTDRKDEYINLFVFANATPNCQEAKTIIESEASTTTNSDSVDSRIIPHLNYHTLPASEEQHSTARRLLVEEDEENTIKNDTSIEELCNVTENSDATKKLEQNRVDSDSEHDNLASIKINNNATVAKAPMTTRSHSNHRSSIGSTLQPVDEKAELDIEELSGCGTTEDQQQKSDKTELVANISDRSAMQSSTNNNGPNALKKVFVPPGFPQRIKPQAGKLPSPTKVNNCNRPTQTPSFSEQPITNSRGSVEYQHLQKQSTNDDPGSSNPKHERIPEDKFIQSVSNRNDLNNLTKTSHTLSNAYQAGNSTCNTNSNFLTKQTDGHGQCMPIIKDGSIEKGIEQNEQVGEFHNGKLEQETSITTNRASSSRSTNEISTHASFSNAITELPKNVSLASQQQTSRHITNSASNNDSNGSRNLTYHQQGDDQRSMTNENINSPTTPTTNLSHHRLPNETSHYSVVRSTSSNLIPASSSPTINSNSTATRSSSMQFNTLSDGESGTDERPSPRYQVSTNSTISTYSTASPTQTTSTRRGDNRVPSGPNNLSKIANDDDLMTPITKTALIFPRLDEGLSSDAESCDDEVEEDDDRAMEGDVDADDDDDDEDDDIDDEDSKSPTELIRNSQSNHTTMDPYIRQQLPAKPQNRSISSMLQQQHISGQILSQSEPPESFINKGDVANYSNFLGQEPTEQGGNKTTTNAYTNQNCTQQNYWMGMSSQQQQSSVPATGMMSAQLTPSNQQFSIQRGHQNAVTNSNSISAHIGAGSGSFNREEVKALNKVSSDTDNETDRLLGPQRTDQLQKVSNNDIMSNNSANEIQPINNYSRQSSANSREVLIEGVLFNVKYLGSTHTDCEGRGDKEDRIQQAELAVHEVKFRNGESQSATEVQLFVSTEKIMVLDDKHRKIMMDHSLRTISYIADIGDAIVLIVRKKNASIDATNELGIPKYKISCHVFESNESHTITKSISQAFHVAYTELLKANATDTTNYLPKELDYQEVLNSQEMSTAELEMFARKDNQREVIVPKNEGEILGLSIVESGWGSVLPTAVIASLKQDGPAYRCKKLSVGDQILSINGISLVGLSLAECQEILRKTKSQRVARLSVVPCPITVEVKIKRPDTKYQLGFSVQNGVICSLLRGGIAERGGIRVGHRIMSINGTTVVGVPHDKIVTLLASSVGEIRMKTCLTSLYRHMLGEEKAVFL